MKHTVRHLSGTCSALSPKGMSMPMSCRTLVAVLALACAALHAEADTGGTGLKMPGNDAVWPRWQGRLLSTMPLWRSAGLSEQENTGRRLESLSLLGDYYFGQSLLTAQVLGGFRATSGLIFGTPSNRALSAYGQGSIGRASLGTASNLSSTAQSNDLYNTPGTVPYLGLGYTSASPRGGWGFSADIGLVAQSAGSAVKLGRVLNGAQTLDDVLRDMRMSPLLNVGVSYLF